MNNNTSPLLSIKDLSITFNNSDTAVVNSINLDIQPNEMLALIGESGSGKSVSAKSILQLNTNVSYQGEILFNGKNLLALDKQKIRAYRGSKIAMIFQEPLTALNPLHTVYRAISEMIELHQSLPKADIEQLTRDLLTKVELGELTDRILHAYPHQLSGGQRQRVMIAMALANKPELLIADEPTTALDVTVGGHIMQLLKKLQAETGMAILFISHDLHTVRKYAERIAVMQHGNIIETNKTEAIFQNPEQDYTQELLHTVPEGAPKTVSEPKEVVLDVDHLKVWFPIKKGFFKRTVDYTKALNDASFTLHKGETLGIVGESGSGKSTLGNAIVGLVKAEGSAVFKDLNVIELDNKEWKPVRKDIQIAFQDPFSSLNPRFQILDIVTEGLKIHTDLNKEQRHQKALEIFERMNLEEDYLYRYPHELSGGQRQRVALARCLLLEPKVLILDEPTSALDRTNQIQIIEILRAEQERTGISYIFISHDLAVVKALSHQIIVLKQGDVVEHSADAEALFKNPQHEYTQTLLESIL